MANANAASKLYVCPTPQNSNLTLEQFELLEWTEIKGLGNVGEMGNNTNILNYDTWSDDVVLKAKGMTDAGSPEIECARIPSDPGQIVLRAAAAVGNNNNYAFKMLRADAQGNGDPSVFYNRGLVTGPRRPNGRNEDFDLVIFTLALQQEEIQNAAGAPTGNAPALSVAPAFSGFSNPPEVGEEGTLGNGTFTGDATITYTYQWFANGVAIPNATTNTYTPVTADIGKKLTGLVRAQNSVGSAIGMTAVTAAVVAGS